MSANLKVTWEMELSPHFTLRGIGYPWNDRCFGSVNPRTYENFGEMGKEEALRGTYVDGDWMEG